MDQKKQSVLRDGFTLVELIVVIVILAILATIAFLSFSSQSSSARDSTRLTDMSNLIKGAKTMQAVGGKMPEPDQKSINIFSGSEQIGTQGYASEAMMRKIKFSNGGKDPLTGEFYIYSANLNLTKGQVLGFLENSESKSIALNPFSSLKTSAYVVGGDYPVEKGDAVGIFLVSDGSGSYIPAQEDPAYSSGIYTLDINNPSNLVAIIDSAEEPSHALVASVPAVISSTGGYNPDTETNTGTSSGLDQPLPPGAFTCPEGYEGAGKQFTSIAAYQVAASPVADYIIFPNQQYDEITGESTMSIHKKSTTDNTISDGIVLSDYPARYPAFSPDGSKIAYKYDRSVLSYNPEDPNYYVPDPNSGKIFIKSSADNGHGTEFINGSNDAPAFSPDGTYIVYRNSDDDRKIYKKLISDTNPENKGSPMTSWEGDHPFFADIGGILYIIYTHRTDYTRINPDTLEEEIYSRYELYKMKADLSDGNGVKITQNGGDRGTISPDGNWIIYNDRDEADSNQEKIFKKSAADNLDGTPITPTGGYRPAYSRDGNWIFYNGPNDVLYKKCAD